MLSLNWKKKDNSEIQNLIKDLGTHLDLRLNEIQSQIKELELTVVQLETKLLTKDLKDKQTYGQIHYRIESIKNNRPKDN
jgi:hypothetical protein